MALSLHKVAVPRERERISTWRALIITMRPHQWTKNLIVFAAPLFGLKVTFHTVEFALLAFFAFCAISSASYIVNDLIDVRADREHPVKRYRALAAGQLPVPYALMAAVCLAVSSILLSLLIAPSVLLAIAIYVLLQISYNLWLKREPILDVMCLSGGFVTRALAGAAAASLQVSVWFLLCVALLATFLAIEKRRAELRALGDTPPSRAVLRNYTVAFLSRIEDVVVASGLISYSVWAAQRTEKHWLLVTVPVVAYVLFKYQMVSEKGGGEEPEMVLLKSRAIIIAIVLWASLSIGIILLQGHGAPWSACGEMC